MTLVAMVLRANVGRQRGWFCSGQLNGGGGSCGGCSGCGGCGGAIDAFLVKIMATVTVGPVVFALHHTFGSFVLFAFETPLKGMFAIKTIPMFVGRRHRSVVHVEALWVEGTQAKPTAQKKFIVGPTRFTDTAYVVATAVWYF